MLRPLVVVVVVLVGSAGHAAAEPAATPGRFSAAVQLGFGYRGIFPFDEEYCGEDDASKSYCLGARPVALDLGLGVAPVRRLELIATLSVGLASDFGAGPGADGPHPLAVAPGARLVLVEFGDSRFWSTLELPIDLTSYDQADTIDLGVRNRNAFEYALTRQIGAFACLGESASWRRWARFELEVGAGVIGRL
jgi:hypothetical protein